jgi:trans-aconitate methyltransferase
MVAATLFTWMQGADFYHDLHAEAVAALPQAEGSRQWIDVGCGPGLVTRLAAARGYQTLGIDINPQMIAAAKQIAKREGSLATFRVGSLEEVTNAKADVVSAASLLAVLADSFAGLKTLWQGVRSGGTLLIIEPTAQMTVDHAQRLLRRGLPGKRSFGLRLWANARQGNAVDPSIYSRLDAAQVDCIPLLDGLVAAWVIRKG